MLCYLTLKYTIWLNDLIIICHLIIYHLSCHLYFTVNYLFILTRLNTVTI